MAWVATENYDSYTTGVDLADQTPAGTGWSAGWADNGIGHWTATTAPTGLSGLAARCGSNTGNTLCWRILTTPVTSGIVQWKMKIDNAAPNDNAVVVLEDGNDPGNRGRCYVRFGPTGNIELYNNTGAAYQSIGAYVINTVYTIALEFDASTDQYRASINGGAYSAFKVPNGGAMADITLIRFENSATNSVEMWVDEIQPYTAAAVANIPGRRIYVMP